MLKMLNSVSSWPKAAPVSAALSSVVGLVEALAFADDQFVDDALQSRSRSSVKSCSTLTAPPANVMIAIRSAAWSSAS